MDFDILLGYYWAELLNVRPIWTERALSFCFKGETIKLRDVICPKSGPSSEDIDSLLLTPVQFRKAVKKIFCPVIQLRSNVSVARYLFSSKCAIT